MGEQEEIVAALQRYFDNADPNDDNLNASLIQDDLQRYGVKLVLMGPAVIIIRLDRLVSWQRPRALGVPEEILNFQLMETGRRLLTEYASLIKATGPFEILSLGAVLPTMLKQNLEDSATIIAYTLGVLAHSRSPLLVTAVTSAMSGFEELFQRAYNTGTKIALAYALFENGQRAKFESYAVPRLTPPEQQNMLKRLLTPGNTQLQELVASMLIMDIASAGRALRPELGWQRRPTKY